MSVRTRMRRFLANRRKARRLKAENEISLVAGVTLGEAESAEFITGRTRDISKTGLSLSLPVTDLQRSLAAVGKSVTILLVLPTKTIHMQGDVVRSESIGESNQIIGVQVTKINDSDKPSYEAYLSSLK